MKAFALNLLYALAAKPAAIGSFVLRLIVVLLCWRGGPWVALLAALLLFSESAAGLLLGKRSGKRVVETADGVRIEVADESRT